MKIQDHDKKFEEF